MGTANTKNSDHPVESEIQEELNSGETYKVEDGFKAITRTEFGITRKTQMVSLTRESSMELLCDKFKPIELLSINTHYSTWLCKSIDPKHKTESDSIFKARIILKCYASLGGLNNLRKTIIPLSKIGDERISKIAECHEDNVKLYLFEELGNDRFPVFEEVNRMISKGRVFTEVTFKTMSFWLIEAMAYAHESGVIHGSLSPDNISYSKTTKKFIISEFSQEVELNKKVLKHSMNINNETLHNESTSKVVPHRYDENFIFSAPEVRQGQEPTAQSDIFSLGMILITIMTGSPPINSSKKPITPTIFSDKEISDLLTKVEGISVNGKDLILKMLSPDPRNRSSAKSILFSDYFKNILTPEQYSKYRVNKAGVIGSKIKDKANGIISEALNEPHPRGESLLRNEDPLEKEEEDLFSIQPCLAVDLFTPSYRTEVYKYYISSLLRKIIHTYISHHRSAKKESKQITILYRILDSNGDQRLSANEIYAGKLKFVNQSLQQVFYVVGAIHSFYSHQIIELLCC